MIDRNFISYCRTCYVPSLVELLVEFCDSNRHFHLCKMSPILDLKRRPPPLHNSVRVFRGWRPLAFLRDLFVSSICPRVFLKDVVAFFRALLLSNWFFSAAVVSQLSGSISVLPQIVFLLNLESTTTWGSR